MDGITLLGLVAALFSSISLLPQVIKSWKTRKTRDLSLPAYLVLWTGVVLWLVYGILISDLPLVIANTICAVFVSSILYLKLKYK